MDAKNGDLPEPCSILSRHYVPSLFSNRFDPTEIMDHFYSFIRHKSKEFIASYGEPKLFPYGPSPRQKVDVFDRDLPSDAPFFVFLHGGMWQAGSPEDYHFIGAPLYKRGIASAFIGYDQLPNVTLGEMSIQAQNAVETILEYADRRGSKFVCLASHSAGCQLLTIAITRPWLSSCPSNRLIKQILLISGVYDLIPMLSTIHRDTLGLIRVIAIKESSMNRTDDLRENLPHNVKVLVVYCEHDAPAALYQAQEYVVNLRASEIETRELYLKDIDHFYVIEQLCDENFILTKEIFRLMEQ